MTSELGFLIRGQVMALSATLGLWGGQAMATDGLNHTQHLRAAGYVTQARSRGEDKGNDGVRPYRSRGSGRGGWAVAAADGASGLWQCQRRHAAHAISSDDRNRSAAKGARLAGRIRKHVAFVQRSELARAAAWSGRGGRNDSQSPDCCPECAGDSRNDTTLVTPRYSPKPGDR